MECIRLSVSFTYVKLMSFAIQTYSMCIFILMLFTALIRHVEMLERAITRNVSRPVVKLKNSGELSGLDMV